MNKKKLISLSNEFIEEPIIFNPHEFFDVGKVEKLKEKYNFELIDNVNHLIDGKIYLVETYETSLIWFLESYKDNKIYLYSKSLPTVRAIVI